MLGGRTRVSKIVDDGEVEACWVLHPRCRKTKSITWVENTWNSVKNGGHLLGKSDGGSGRRGKPPAGNTRPPGRGFGRTSSRSVHSTSAQTAVNGANGIGHADILLRPCAANGCDVIGLQKAKGTEYPKSCHLHTAFFSAVIAAGSKVETGNMGLGWR